MAVKIEFAGICTHIESTEEKLHRVVIFGTPPNGACGIAAHRAALSSKPISKDLRGGMRVRIEGGAEGIVYDRDSWPKLARLGEHRGWQPDEDVLSGKSNAAAYFEFRDGRFTTICTKKGARLVQVEIEAGPNPKLVIDEIVHDISENEKICVGNMSEEGPKVGETSHFFLHYIGLRGGRCELPTTPKTPEKGAEEGTPICPSEIASLGPECSNAGFP